LYVPSDLAPDAPVLSMAHGTIGLSDCSAPSKDHESHEAEIAYFSGLAKEGVPEGQFNNGAIVVATDYEGLGTPGTHTYLVGRSEGANVLDAIRAARQITGTEGQAITIGHSQGGGAALWAAQMAPEYAPDVDLVGAVAAAPAMEYRRMVPLIDGDNLGFLPMVVGGFAAAYPEVDPADYMTPKGIETIEAMAETCNDTFESLAGAPKADYFKADLAEVEPLASLLDENSPGDISTDVPILVVHGDADEVVPFQGMGWLQERTCKTGGFTIDFKAYPGADHSSVLVDAHPDITTFLADRLAGNPPASTPCP
jgi:pimeloyl-ACP methyl ester carboxylesterase